MLVETVDRQNLRERGSGEGDIADEGERKVREGGKGKRERERGEAALSNHFHKTCRILKVLGRSLGDFLNNLDNLHE